MTFRYSPSNSIEGFIWIFLWLPRILPFLQLRSTLEIGNNADSLPDDTGKWSFIVSDQASPNIRKKTQQQKKPKPTQQRTPAKTPRTNKQATSISLFATIPYRRNTFWGEKKAALKVHLRIFSSCALCICRRDIIHALPLFKEKYFPAHMNLLELRKQSAITVVSLRISKVGAQSWWDHAVLCR